MRNKLVKSLRKNFLLQSMHEKQIPLMEEGPARRAQLKSGKQRAGFKKEFRNFKKFYMKTFKNQQRFGLEKPL